MNTLKYINIIFLSMAFIMSSCGELIGDSNLDDDLSIENVSDYNGNSERQCYVEPYTFQLGSSYTVYGSNLRKNRQHQLTVTQDTSNESHSFMTESDGSFAIELQAEYQGVGQIKIYRRSWFGMRLQAECSFEVSDECIAKTCEDLDVECGVYDDGCGGQVDCGPCVEPEPEPDPTENSRYVSTDGNDTNPGTMDAPFRTLTKAAATVLPGETVFIREGEYRERLVPQNSGTANEPITFSAYPNEQVTLNGDGVSMPANWGGLIDVSGLSHIKIHGIRVINAGTDFNHVGILVDHSNSISIKNCYTFNTASSGIGVWNSSDVVIDNNEVVQACHNGEQECISVAVTDGFQVSNNKVHDSVNSQYGGEGIDIKDGSANGKVFRNHVYNISRLGIYVDSWDKHTYNIEVFNNVVHDCKDTGFALAAEAGGLLENIKVYNNIAYGNFYGGLTVAGWGESGASHPISGVLVINNTFFGNGPNDWGPGIVLENSESSNIYIRNNILSQNGYDQVSLEAVGSGLVFDHNICFGDNESALSLECTNVNPMMVNPQAGDFHLLSDSPARDTGSSSEAPIDDYDGNQRPLGSGVDIGAFEYTP